MDRTFSEVKRQFRTWQHAQAYIAECERPKSREELRQDEAVQYGMWLHACAVKREAEREAKRAIRAGAPEALALFARFERATIEERFIWGNYVKARVLAGSER